MRIALLVSAMLLVTASAAVTLPTAQASPCRNPGDCINMVLEALGCWDAGGDPTSEPLTWTPGGIVICLLSVTS